MPSELKKFKSLSYALWIHFLISFYFIMISQICKYSEILTASLPYVPCSCIMIERHGNGRPITPWPSTAATVRLQANVYSCIHLLIILTQTARSQHRYISTRNGNTGKITLSRCVLKLSILKFNLVFRKSIPSHRWHCLSITRTSRLMPLRQQ
jgi:hypothetical protein